MNIHRLDTDFKVINLTMLDTHLHCGLHDLHSSKVNFVQLGGVAQLVRALACHARGRGFESRHSRHLPKLKLRNKG